MKNALRALRGIALIARKIAVEFTVHLCGKKFLSYFISAFLVITFTQILSEKAYNALYGTQQRI
jgi:hypothetical protein